MATSDRTFNQVKAILGKLDRAVDEARNRRSLASQPAPVPPPPPPAPVAVAPAPAAVPAAGPARPGSQFGRAQPLRPATDPTMRWSANQS